jgi:ATP-binding cassette subfamily F protein 3
MAGGQKSRVAFCKATWDSPHLLMLDEPTNHLDVEAVDALIEAINDFKGGVIMVSHDQVCEYNNHDMK